MKFLSRWLPLLGFRGSSNYWEQRYRYGGDSGAGSYGESARYKAEVLNRFVADHAVETVIEFGCGDGHQLGLAIYPQYVGVDVSPSAIERCRTLFAADAGKMFVTLDAYDGRMADLSLSLDVLYHLVEDDVYGRYLETLFAAARRHVVIYSTSVRGGTPTLRHVRHRDVETDIASRFPSFRRMVDEESWLPPPLAVKGDLQTRFFLYERTGA